MRSASCSVIRVPTQRRFMPRLTFLLCAPWHFPGREVPDEDVATSCWRLSFAAPQLGLQAENPRALLAGVCLLSPEEEDFSYLHSTGLTVCDATSPPTTGGMGRSPQC